MGLRSLAASALVAGGLALGLGGCSTSASSSTGVLTGFVQRCTAYQPPAGFEVRIYRGDVPVATQHVASSSVAYRFDLPAGRYTLTDFASPTSGEPVVVVSGATVHQSIPNTICF